MMKLNERTGKLLGDVLITFLIGAGITMIGYEGVFTSLNPLFVYGVTALIAAVMFCMSISRASGWITLLTLVSAALVAVIAGWRPVGRLNGMIENLNSNGSLETYKAELIVASLLVFYVTIYIVVHQSDGDCVLALIVLCYFGVAWFMTGTSASIHILPVLIGLSAIFARGEGGGTKLKALFTLSLISAVLACAIVPGEGVKSAWLEEASHKTLSKIMHIFNIEKENLDERRSFTIASDGWLTRKDFIGGPAYPREDELLRVYAPEKLYLRGAIRYIYNNRAWVDEDNESKAGKIKRYMLGGIEGLVYRDEFERAFDLDKRALDEYFRTETVTVEVLADSSFWSIYSPNRTENVSLDGEVNAYYNNVGELFAGRPLAAGDRYELTVNVPDIPESSIADAIASVQGGKDGAYASVLLLNRDLPEGIEPELYTLTYEIIKGLETPYEKACALRDWLAANGTYTLRGDYAPENSDFASWFVLNSRKGYCAYYACAMTVMARIAGLPARYVEGYLVSPDDTGECVVTGKNAHAWTEIYFENFGWLTFDATPARLTDENERRTANDGGNSDEADAGNNDFEPESTPTPTPTLPPRNTPEPTEEPESGATTPEPTQEPKGGSPESTSEPDNEGDPGQDSDGSEEKSAKGKKRLWIPLIVLLLLAFIAWRIRERIRLTDPANMAKGETNSENRLMIWYRAMLTALGASGLVYEIGLTPAAFAEKAQTAGLCTEDFALFSKEVARCRYAEAEADGETYRLAERAYAGIGKRMRRAAKIRWLVKRVISGIGKLDPVP